VRAAHGGRHRVLVLGQIADLAGIEVLAARLERALVGHLAQRLVRQRPGEAG
jgi:hypothetical protein